MLELVSLLLTFMSNKLHIFVISVNQLIAPKSIENRSFNELK